MGGLLIIGTIDHTKIQSIERRPFPTLSHIIPCFRMVELKHSVRANSDPSWQHIQEIASFQQKNLSSNPLLKHEFINLVSQHSTFVLDWDSNLITSSTIRLYARKVPAKEAMKQFVSRFCQNIHISLIRESTSQDLEKSRFSHREWHRAYESIFNQFDQQLKEPRSLLFFLVQNMK